MDHDYIVFGSPSIEQEEKDEVMGCMNRAWLGTGPKVQEFESQFAAYKSLQPNQAAAVNSCTAALHLSLLAADIGPGDEVITTAMTFVATVNAIIHAGATPVLADINAASYNIDPKEIERRITQNTKAIVPVHFAGYPCEMDEICKLANRYDLTIIEDCAHAAETEYKGEKAGTIGDFGCFSFYATKNITTGEGGMICTQSEEKTNKIKNLALHGLSKDAWHRFSDQGYKHYQAIDLGFKYNMMDIQAAIGIHQLRRIEENHLKRKKIWEYYSEELKQCPIQLPPTLSPNSKHGYHLFTILLQSPKISRDELLISLHERNIGTGVHYLSIATHPYHKNRFGWLESDYPNALQVGKTTLSLPLSPGLNDLQVERVVEEIKILLKNK